MRRYEYTVTDVHGRSEKRVISRDDMPNVVTFGIMIRTHEAVAGTAHKLEALITDGETTWSLFEISRGESE